MVLNRKGLPLPTFRPSIPLSFPHLSSPYPSEPSSLFPFNTFPSSTPPFLPFPSKPVKLDHHYSHKNQRILSKWVAVLILSFSPSLVFITARLKPYFKTSIVSKTCPRLCLLQLLSKGGPYPNIILPPDKNYWTDGLQDVLSIELDRISATSSDIDDISPDTKSLSPSCCSVPCEASLEVDDTHRIYGREYYGQVRFQDHLDDWTTRFIVWLWMDDST